jgi:DNA-binding transcriptional LysR family regulator
MTISLKNIRYFIAVAEAESITGAAHELNVSQSVLTEAVKALESDLAVNLFQRHARGMVLTHAGHQFLSHAHQILGAVRNARLALSARPDTMAGQLNIGVTSLVTGYFLPYLLGRFRRTFPKVEVKVIEDQRDYIEHLLVNGELDAAVLIVSNLQNRQAIEAEVLVESPYRLWLPTHHPLLELGTISISEMMHEPLVMLRLDELEDSITSSWRAAGHRPHVVLRTESVEGARSLVASGEGLAILPDMLYRPWSLDGDRLEARGLQEPMPSLQLGIAWRRGSQLSRITRDFLMIAREHSRGRG